MYAAQLQQAAAAAAAAIAQQKQQESIRQQKDLSTQQQDYKRVKHAGGSSRLQAMTRGEDGFCLPSAVDGGGCNLVMDPAAPSSTAAAMGPTNNSATSNNQHTTSLEALGAVQPAPAAAAPGNHNQEHHNQEQPGGSSTAPKEGYTPQLQESPAVPYHQQQPTPMPAAAYPSLSYPMPMLAASLDGNNTAAQPAQPAGPGLFNPQQPNDLYLSNSVPAWGPFDHFLGTTATGQQASAGSSIGAAAAAAPGKVCSHCGKVEQRQWRKRGDGTLLCNRCFMWRRNHGGVILPPLDPVSAPSRSTTSHTSTHTKHSAGRSAAHGSTKGSGSQVNYMHYSMPQSPDALMDSNALSAGFFPGMDGPGSYPDYPNSNIRQGWYPEAAGEEDETTRSSFSGHSGHSDQATDGRQHRARRGSSAGGRSPQAHSRAAAGEHAAAAAGAAGAGGEYYQQEQQHTGHHRLQQQHHHGSKKRPHHVMSVEDEEAASAAEVLADLLPKAVTSATSSGGHSAQYLDGGTTYGVRSGRRRAQHDEMTQHDDCAGGYSMPQSPDTPTSGMPYGAAAADGAAGGGAGGHGSIIHEVSFRAGVGGPGSSSGGAAGAQVGDGGGSVGDGPGNMDAAHDGLGSGKGHNGVLGSSTAAAGNTGAGEGALAGQAAGVGAVSPAVSLAYMAAMLAGVPAAQLNLPSIQRSFEAMQQQAGVSDQARQFLAFMTRSPT